MRSRSPELDLPAEIFQPFERLSVGVHPRGQAAVGRCRDRLGQPLDVGFGGTQIGGLWEQHIAQWGVIRHVESLRQIANAQTGRVEDHAAAVGRDLAQDDAQQRGLAAAVGADQPDALARIDGEGDVLEQQRFCAGKAFGDV